MSKLPTEIGSRIHPHGDGADHVVELTEDGWVSLSDGYRYWDPEWAIGAFGFDVLEPRGDA